MDLGEIVCGGVDDWSGSRKGEVESCCEFGNEPSVSVNLWEEECIFISRSFQGNFEFKWGIRI
jgi:hypothetical protein